MKNCPALAYAKDPVSGAVNVDPDLCIGCRYCTWACPYDAPRFNTSRGVVEKCTFCNHRLQEGLEPACVTSCPTGALKLADHDPGFRNAITAGFPIANAEPAIRFIPLEEGRILPDSAAPKTALSVSGGARSDGSASNVSLRHEWVLVFFTLLVPALFAVFVSADVFSRTGALIYAGCGMSGMLASAAHLGRWERAHRAILNWRDSWLSREIILVSLFLGLSSVTLFFGWNSAVIRWTTALIGIAALYAIDRVYHVTATRRLDAHSARVLLTGLLFVGLLGEFSAVVYVAGGVKLLLYLSRKRYLAREQRPSRPVLTGVRVAMGFVLPVVMWYVSVDTLRPLIIAAVVIGEAIDRCEFYLELDVPTLPEVTDRDLAGEITRLADAGA